MHDTERLLLGLLLAVPTLSVLALVREVIAAQRAAIVGLRNEGTINNEVMRRIERELDLEESRLKS